MFYEKAVLLKTSNKATKKIKDKKIWTNRKTPVLESPVNSEYCEIFKSTYFEEHLRTAASKNVLMKLRKIKNYS